MPNHHCCVPGCSADSRKDPALDKFKFLKGVTFHAFPRDPELKDLWLKLIKRDDYIPNRYSRVCSLHFAEKAGPSPKNPCPTVFAYNNFTGKIPTELIDQVMEASVRERQRASLKSPQFIMSNTNQQPVTAPTLTGNFMRPDLAGKVPQQFMMGSYPNVMMIQGTNSSTPGQPQFQLVQNIRTTQPGTTSLQNLRIVQPGTQNLQNLRILQAGTQHPQNLRLVQSGGQNIQNIRTVQTATQNNVPQKPKTTPSPGNTTAAATEIKSEKSHIDLTSEDNRDTITERRNQEIEEARREVMSLAEKRRHHQEELKRVQEEIVAKAAANAQLLASIHEAEKSGQIQLIDEADIKAIQEATQQSEMQTNLTNPYQFINENTTHLWDATKVTDNVKNSGQIIKKVEGVEGSWEVVPVESTTTTKTDSTTPTESNKRKRSHEEVDLDLEEMQDTEGDNGGEEEDSSEEDETSEDDEDDDGGAEKKSASESKKRKVEDKPVTTDEDLMAVVAQAEALEEELTEQMLRPPLLNEPQEVTQMRERLTVRGPHHNFLPKPRCKFCDLFFQSIESLLGHLYRHTDRPYQCVECGATFRKAAELESHIDVHLHREAEVSHYYRVLGTKQGILECPVEACSWHSGGWIRLFAAHIKQHNQGCCVLCGEGLHGGSEPHFMKHVKKHMAWTKNLKCPLCPATKPALPRNMLDNHIKTQHGSQIKPWACYHCDNHKVIPRFCELDLHLLKNHSSNPYECQYCGAAYPSLYGLRNHARKHHKRGKEHDDKYEWVEVVHKQNASKETKLPSTRKSTTYQRVNMLPQTGDRQMQSQNQQTSFMSLITNPGQKLSLPSALQSGKIAIPQLPGNLITIPQGKSSTQALTIPISSPTAVTKSGTSVTAAAGSSTKSPQHFMRRYKPQKVFVMQKDGTRVEKTLLLPVDEGQRVAQVPTGAVPQVVKGVEGAGQAGQQAMPKIMKVQIPPGFKLGPNVQGTTLKTVPAAGGVKVATAQNLTIPKPAPVVKQVKLPATSGSTQLATPSSSAGIPQASLADIASGNLPGGVDIVDESILESLGISSQDLELGPVTESDENLGFTITEVQGDIDFGSLPEEAANKDSELEAKAVVPSLSLTEENEEKATKKVRCPYRACTETFDTAVGFWRQHYLKMHFKRSDLYEFMCRNCGELFANWDWPPEGHDCKKPRWACICADCGDIFENQRKKHAHFPDCITFQKYTPTKAATVITDRTCLYCHTTCKSIADLCSHIRVSHVSRRFNSLAIHCYFCNDYPTFPKADALWNHYKTKHLEWWQKQPVWVCNKCGETHTTEYDLKKHAVYTHAEDITPNFLCNQCPYVFGQRTLFDMHKQIAHKD